MKRLTGEATQCLAANYEGSDLGRALADLHRYKAALEEIEKEPCVYAGWSGSHCCEAYEGKWCLSCVAEKALSDDDEKAAT